MTLDEAEKLARTVAELHKHDQPGEGHVSTDLARALLAMLPVVRAAIAVDDDETNDNDLYAREYHRKVLREAVDNLRRAMEGK